MNDDENEIELANTGLCVRNDCLVKESPGCQVIAYHALVDIQKVQLQRGWDKTAIILCALLLGLAFVAWYYIPWTGWNWVATIVLMAFASIFIGSIRELRLRLYLQNGEVVYAIKDNGDDGVGFTMTLMNLVQEKRNEITLEQMADKKKQKR